LVVSHSAARRNRQVAVTQEGVVEVVGPSVVLKQAVWTKSP
jgi:hypothetical protein